MHVSNTTHYFLSNSSLLCLLALSKQPLKSTRAFCNVGKAQSIYIRGRRRAKRGWLLGRWIWWLLLSLFYSGTFPKQNFIFLSILLSTWDFLYLLCFRLRMLFSFLGFDFYQRMYGFAACLIAGLACMFLVCASIQLSFSLVQAIRQVFM